ncbi:hypothetical protein LUZ60_011512 [Juncus effusus]|nr:hypothetical protein LUZ60_011512 [Juncus effusus]
MALRKHNPDPDGKQLTKPSLNMNPLNFKIPIRVPGRDPNPVEPDPDIDTREVYFLIMHFLSSGLCKQTYTQLWNELLENRLLPRRYHAWHSRSGTSSGVEDDDGTSLPLCYSNLIERYPHVGKDHLVRLLKQLIQSSSPQLNGGLLAASTCRAADVPTLLGSGSFSLLSSDRYSNSSDGSRTKLPGHLRWPHMHADQVRGLGLREIGGGFSKHHRAPSVRAACYAIAKPSTLVQKMQIIKKLRGHQNAVYCATFDRSGRFVITGSDDRLVKIWSMETAFCLASCRGHEGDITDLAVSSNNALVASSSNDFIIRVWRIPDGLPISVLKGHTLAVTAITFSPRPSAVYQLLSSSDDGTCRIWDARHSQQSLRVYVPKPVENPAGRTGEPSTSTTAPAVQPPHQILCCAFNANGTVFVTGSSDTFARVWNACRFSAEESNEPIHEMDLLSGHENDVNYVQFSGCAVPSRSSFGDIPKEDNIPKFKNSWFTHDNIVTCSRDGSAIIWVPRSRRSHGKVGRWTRAYHLKVPPPPMAPQPTRGGPRQRFQPTPRGVNMIVWSLDNRFVLAAIMDCRICVWNASDGSLVHSLIGHKASTFVLDVHPFNPRIAMSAGYDGQTIIWDIWEGKPVQIYETGQFKLVDGKFSPDGTSIILSDEVGQIFIISTGQGESQKDARYDQFFLGDYRPLARDANGNVLDQETQLQPYRRNMQDFLCDSTMIPYPEPYQSMYQRRRLGTLGIEWRPPSVKFAVGPAYNATTGEFQNLPVIDLDIWAEPLPEFNADMIDWEQQDNNDNQTDEDLSDSEFNLTDECSSEGEEQEVISVSESGESERDADVSVMDADRARAGKAGLRRSKRKKHKHAAELVTSSGRRVKRRNMEEDNGQVAEGPSRPHKGRKAKHTGRKKLPKSKTALRPQRRAARNALSLFSKINGASSDGEEEEDELEEEEEQESEYSSSSEDYDDDDDAVMMQSKESVEPSERMQERDGSGPSQFVPAPSQTERRRLILKLPRRDPTVLFAASETVKAESSSKQATVSAPKQETEPEPQLESEPRPEPVPVSSGTEKKDEAEPVPVSSGTIRWGEVKQRSAKRPKLADEAGPSDDYKPPVNNMKSPELDDNTRVELSTCVDESRAVAGTSEPNDVAQAGTSGTRQTEPVTYKRLRIKSSGLANEKPKLVTNKSEEDEVYVSQRTANNTERYNGREVETGTDPSSQKRKEKVRVVYTRSNKPGKKRKEMDSDTNYNDESTSNSRDMDADYDAAADEDDSRLVMGIRERSSRSRHNNRRENRREALSYGEARQIERRRNLPVRKLSWLMLLEHEESYRYIPQMGDEVAYLRQGHEEYIKGSPRSNPEPLPYKTLRNLKSVEWCKVKALNYSTFSGSGEGCCKLTLFFSDPGSVGFNKEFRITLPELVGFPDFLVERARFEGSMERGWAVRDKCQVWWRSEDGDGGSWWEGRITGVKPKSSEFPDSPWEKYVIQYKNDASELHSHSPWELHDLDGQWYHPHIDNRTRDKLLSSISKLEHTNNRNQDSYGIQKLTLAAQKPEFINRFPVQFSVEVIKRRLENNYYRTIESVKHDASVMLSNAESYFGRNAGMAAKMRRLGDWIERTFSSL